MNDIDINRPLVIVSCDSHVGPKLVEHLRPYCPKKYLDAFDADVARQAGGAEQHAERHDGRQDAPDEPDVRPSQPGTGRALGSGRPGSPTWTATAWRPKSSGTSAKTGRTCPGSASASATSTPHQLELGAVAYEMYNRWLADFCATDPSPPARPRLHPELGHRRVRSGPLQWAAEHGLKGVNFPAPGRPCVKEYNHWDWDPFWSA